MSQPLVTAENVGYTYGNRRALNDVSFQVSPGVIFGLLGPNGSGKTTLFRLLSTLIPMQQGRLSVGGLDVSVQQTLVRQQLGVTFQSPALDVRLTVEENLRCHAALYGLSGAVLRARLETLLTEFGISDRRSTIVGQLSGGLKRRVELAKGLLHKPSVLLLDEPTSGLDPRARQEFWSLLQYQVQEYQTTVIVATHLMPEAELCHQLLFLDHGRTIAEGTPEQLQSALSGERLTVRLRHPEQTRSQLEAALETSGVLAGDRLLLRVTRPAEQVAVVLNQFGDQMLGLEFTRPSLEDVFMELTGRHFNAEEQVQ